MSKPIKVLIADDHDIVLDGLKSILNPFVAESGAAPTHSDAHPFQIVGVAESGEAVLARLASLPEVDVVVLDYYMSGKNGLDTALEIKAKHPAIRVVLFSMEESDAIITEAFAQNLDGYVTKSEGRRRLLDAIKRVHKGERVFPMLKQAKSAALPWQPVAKTALADTEILSKREKEVACLIVQGRTTQQIADTLSIAFNTVEVHRNNIYRKLEINRVAELVKYALENNLCG
ncbi:MAG: response regulator transcription factor [Saprospiraceae bacterium]|jgi:DNA-binding NarL/FixJ family response regulator|nr:response regulator transcription factor [Saprospiraceae bacterium]